MENSEVAGFLLAVIGVVMTLVANSVGLIKYINKRTDDGDKILHVKIERSQRDHIEAIADIKDKYVKRDDLDRDLNSLTSEIRQFKRDFRGDLTELKQENRDSLNGIKSQLDSITETLIKGAIQK